MTVHIGTSGCHYKEWKGKFYPAELDSGHMLDFYAQEFDAVEINSSFYRLPEESTVRSWKESTPSDFTFAFKASRYLTHMKRLKDPAEPLENILAKARILGGKLGPLLFQLPPKWRVDVDRLDDFLQLLPAEVSTAFEFRDPSWFTEDVYSRLREHGAGLCIYDLEGETSPAEVTGDVVYVRLHGPERRYQGRYSRERISGWAGAISSWHKAGREVYCFFDNDQQAYAAENALELRDMLA